MGLRDPRLRGDDAFLGRANTRSRDVGTVSRLDKSRDKESPVQLSENALRVLEKRYLKKDDQGRAVETPEEMFRRVARAVAQADLRYVDDAPVQETEAQEAKAQEPEAEPTEAKPKAKRTRKRATKADAEAKPKAKRRSPRKTKKAAEAPEGEEQA